LIEEGSKRIPRKTKKALKQTLDANLQYVQTLSEGKRKAVDAALYRIQLLRKDPSNERYDTALRYIEKAKEL